MRPVTADVLPGAQRTPGDPDRHDIPEGGRGFVFNAGPAALVTFLEIGTRVADIRDR